MFNRGARPRQVSVDLGEIGFGHGAQVRDVWQAKDRGSYSSKFTDTVPWHGVSLLILSKSRVDVASTTDIASHHPPLKGAGPAFVLLSVRIALQGGLWRSGGVF